MNEKDKIIKEFLINILLDAERNRLNGNGYDFYFVLMAELDKIINTKKTVSSFEACGDE